MTGIEEFLKNLKLTADAKQQVRLALAKIPEEQLKPFLKKEWYVEQDIASAAAEYIPFSNFFNSKPTYKEPIPLRVPSNFIIFGTLYIHHHLAVPYNMWINKEKNGNKRAIQLIAYAIIDHAGFNDTDKIALLKNLLTDDRKQLTLFEQVEATYQAEKQQAEELAARHQQTIEAKKREDSLHYFKNAEEKIIALYKQDTVNQVLQIASKEQIQKLTTLPFKDDNSNTGSLEFSAALLEKLKKEIAEKFKIYLIELVNEVAEINSFECIQEHKDLFSVLGNVITQHSIYYKHAQDILQTLQAYLQLRGIKVSNFPHDTPIVVLFKTLDQTQNTLQRRVKILAWLGYPIDTQTPDKFRIDEFKLLCDQIVNEIKQCFKNYTDELGIAMAAYINALKDFSKDPKSLPHILTPLLSIYMVESISTYTNQKTGAIVQKNVGLLKYFFMYMEIKREQLTKLQEQYDTEDLRKFSREFKFFIDYKESFFTATGEFIKYQLPRGKNRDHLSVTIVSATDAMNKGLDLAVDSLEPTFPTEFHCLEKRIKLLEDFAAGLTSAINKELSVFEEPEKTTLSLLELKKHYETVIQTKKQQEIDLKCIAHKLYESDKPKGTMHRASSSGSLNSTNPQQDRNNEERNRYLRESIQSLQEHNNTCWKEILLQVRNYLPAIKTDSFTEQPSLTDIKALEDQLSEEAIQSLFTDTARLLKIQYTSQTKLADLIDQLKTHDNCLDKALAYYQVTAKSLSFADKVNLLKEKILQELNNTLTQAATILGITDYARADNLESAEQQRVAYEKRIDKLFSGDYSLHHSIVDLYGIQQLDNKLTALSTKFNTLQQQLTATAGVLGIAYEKPKDFLAAQTLEKSYHNELDNALRDFKIEPSSVKLLHTKTHVLRKAKDTLARAYSLLGKEPGSAAEQKATDRQQELTTLGLELTDAINAFRTMSNHFVKTQAYDLIGSTKEKNDLLEEYLKNWQQNIVNKLTVITEKSEFLSVDDKGLEIRNALPKIISYPFVAEHKSWPETLNTMISGLDSLLTIRIKNLMETKQLIEKINELNIMVGDEYIDHDKIKSTITSTDLKEVNKKINYYNFLDFLFYQIKKPFLEFLEKNYPTIAESYYNSSGLTSGISDGNVIPEFLTEVDRLFALSEKLGLENIHFMNEQGANFLKQNNFKFATAAPAIEGPLQRECLFVDKLKALFDAKLSVSKDVGGDANVPKDSNVVPLSNDKDQKAIMRAFIKILEIRIEESALERKNDIRRFFIPCWAGRKLAKEKALNDLQDKIAAEVVAESTKTLQNVIAESLGDKELKHNLFIGHRTGWPIFNWTSRTEQLVSAVLEEKSDGVMMEQFNHFVVKRSRMKVNSQ